MELDEIKQQVTLEIQNMELNSASPLNEEFKTQWIESRIKTLSDKAVAPAAPKAEVPKVEVPKTETPKTETPKVETPQSTGDPFVDAILKANGVTAAKPGVIKTPEDAQRVLEEKAGVKTFDEFFGKFDEFKSKVEEELPKIQKERDDVVAAMSLLPEDLFLLNQKAWAGEDWRADLNKSNFDFTQDVSKVGKKELVNYFYPGEFTEADFEAPAGTNPALKIAEKEAVEKFKARQTEIKSTSQKLIDKVQQESTILATSLDSSFKNLESSMLKEAPKDQVKKVKEVLAKGKAGVLEIFFNKDGSYKEDALEKAILAEFGKDAIKKIVSHVSKQSAGAAVEEAIESKRESRAAAGDAGKQTSDEKLLEMKKAIGLSGINGNKTFEHIERKRS